ncbi:hypothetical protein JCM5296_000042 [Sporobolomyces johnsonii]
MSSCTPTLNSQPVDVVAALTARAKIMGIVGACNFGAFRRTAANALNGQSVSVADRQFAMMGHNVVSKVFDQYISRLSSVDTANLVSSRAEDRARFEALKGFECVLRDAPIGLDADSWEVIHADTEMTAAVAALDQVLQCDALDGQTTC